MEDDMPVHPQPLAERVAFLRYLAQKVTAFEASGCEVTDPYDTYPPELWSAATRHTSLMPLVEALQQQASAPLDAVLFCPKCGLQHIDEPHGDWTNPPHKSHLCQNSACNLVWRPLEVATNGVRALKTRGVSDSDLVHRAVPAAP